MPDVWLECVACAARYEVAPLFHGCTRCRREGRIAPVEVRYDLDKIDAKPEHKNPGLWRWQRLLPPVDVYHRISLGEGNTPLLELRIDGSKRTILLKNETQNPTWSWKDRPNAVTASLARQFGFPALAAFSTGNHGCATAAYAAAAKLDCVVYCHNEAPSLQAALMTGYGAKVIRGTDHESHLAALIERGDHFPSTILCPRAGYSNPFGVEGFKTIAFEIWEHLGRKVPACVFVPVGSGDGIYGIWKGFDELHALGLIEQMPRMIACQSAGADSAYRAYRQHAMRIEPLSTVCTTALSIAEHATGNHALRAVYASAGEVLIASDDEAERASTIAFQQGFALERASAVALACAQQAAQETDADERWAVIGSGAAVKWMANSARCN